MAGSRPITIGKLARLANLKVTIEKEGKNAHVLIPFLTLDDIDRTGNVGAARVQKMMSMARMAAYHTPNIDTGETFLEYDKFTADFYTFLASVETEISREFYELPKQEEWPGVRINFHLGYVGGASLNSVATLKDASTGTSLAWNTNTVVCVDKSTRKPAPIPNWWKDKYQDAIVGNKKLVVAPLRVPDETSQYQLKVSWNDVDAYKHANYSAYLRYCFDAAMDGMSAGYFSKFTGDIFHYHVKKMQLLYIGETNAGDFINVSSWEDKENPYILHFRMKRGTKDIFQCTLEFFETTS